MAESKNSFVLYVDLKATIDQLPDDKAGQLFKLILDYVNDLNPEPIDLLLKIAFEPIRQQLKRDLVKWDAFKQKQAENGSKGGRPKKPNDNPKNPGLLEETQKSLSVSVTVSDSVNGTYTEIQINNFKKFEVWLSENAPRVQKMKIPFNPKSYEQCLSNFAKKFNSDESKAKENLKNILINMHNKGSLLKDYLDASLTAQSWLKMQLKREIEATTIKKFAPTENLLPLPKQNG